MRAGPLRRRIGRRDELRNLLTGRAIKRIVQGLDIFPHRPLGVLGNIRRLPFWPWNGALLVGVGLDQAGIHGKAFTARQAFRHATLNRTFKQMPQNIALAEAAVAVDRKARMIRRLAIEPQAAEPAIGQIEMDLFAEPPLGPDAKAVADDQHPDQQFRIDRGTAEMAVIRFQ